MSISRSPPHRVAAMDGSLHRFRCESCGDTHRVETTFNYVDFDRRQLFRVYPPGEEQHWASREVEVVKQVERSAAEPAPAFAREQLSNLLVRTLFGLDALREKLHVLACGGDDAALELAKLDWMRASPLARMRADRRPRVVSSTPEDLQLLLPDGESWAVSCESLRRAPSEDRRRLVAQGSYVDVGRTLLDGA